MLYYDLNEIVFYKKNILGDHSLKIKQQLMTTTNNSNSPAMNF